MAERAGLESCCPRCGGAFHCGAADAAACACTTLRLPDSLLARLNAQYRGCLCLRCLGVLAQACEPTRLQRDGSATSG